MCSGSSLWFLICKFYASGFQILVCFTHLECLSNYRLLCPPKGIFTCIFLYSFLISVFVFLFVESGNASPNTVLNSVGRECTTCLLTSSLEILMNAVYRSALRNWPCHRKTHTWNLISMCIHFSMATRMNWFNLSNGSVWALFVLNKMFILVTKFFILKNWGLSRTWESRLFESNSKRNWEIVFKNEKNPYFQV